MSPEDAAAFGQLFADYELLPPFRQLDRNCYTLTPDELTASELTRWAGRKCPSGRVIGLANKGWLRGDPQDAGWIGWMLKPLGQWALVMEIDEGFAVGMLPDELSAEQQLTKVWLFPEAPGSTDGAATAISRQPFRCWIKSPLAN